jgi:hypothetical protein
MSMVRAEYPQLLAPGASEIFTDYLDLKDRKDFLEDIFHELPSTKAYEDDAFISGFGAAQITPENAPVPFVDLIQGGSVRYIMLKSTLAARVSWELVEDDQYDKISKLLEGLANSANFTISQSGANILNNGFTLIKTVDGVTLFNSQHPLLRGSEATNIGPGVSFTSYAPGTFPNRPSVDVQLSVAGIQMCTTQMERMIDQSGLAISIKPKKIVIPPELRFTAAEILGSAGKVDSSDNNINSILGENLTYRICNFLESPTNWFAFADKSQHRMKHFTRTPITFDLDDDFNTLAFKFLMFYREAWGVTVYYGTWGSSPV